MAFERVGPEGELASRPTYRALLEDTTRERTSAPIAPAAYLEVSPPAPKA